MEFKEHGGFTNVKIESSLEHPEIIDAKYFYKAARILSIWAIRPMLDKGRALITEEDKEQAKAFQAIARLLLNTGGFMNE